MDKLDRYDLNILAELQRNAALSNQELAERIGLSPSPCSRRVKQLEDDGYIIGQVALLDRKKLGLSLTAYVLIGMDRHTPERFEHFQEEIRKMPGGAGMLPGDRDGRRLSAQGGGAGHGSLPETATRHPDPNRRSIQRTFKLRAAADSVQHAVAVAASARLIVAGLNGSCCGQSQGAYNPRPAFSVRIPRHHGNRTIRSVDDVRPGGRTDPVHVLHHLGSGEEVQGWPPGNRDPVPWPGSVPVRLPGQTDHHLHHRDRTRHSRLSDHRIPDSAKNV